MGRKRLSDPRGRGGNGECGRPFELMPIFKRANYCLILKLGLRSAYDKVRPKLIMMSVKLAIIPTALELNLRPGCQSSVRVLWKQLAVSINKCVCASSLSLLSSLLSLSISLLLGVF